MAESQASFDEAGTQTQSAPELGDRLLPECRIGPLVSHPPTRHDAWLPDRSDQQQVFRIVPAEMVFALVEQPARARQTPALTIGNSQDVPASAEAKQPVITVHLGPADECVDQLMRRERSRLEDVFETPVTEPEHWAEKRLVDRWRAFDELPERLPGHARFCQKG